MSTDTREEQLHQAADAYDSEAKLHRANALYGSIIEQTKSLLADVMTDSTTLHAAYVVSQTELGEARQRIAELEERSGQTESDGQVVMDTETHPSTVDVSANGEG